MLSQEIAAPPKEVGSQRESEKCRLAVTSDEAHYDGTTLILVGHVSLDHPIGTIEAAEARLTCETREGKIHPLHCLFSKEVRLTHREENQYALADRLTYYPDQHKILLEGFEHPVLFFDKNREMHLSAQQIEAIQDPLTHQYEVKGIGKVRFVFSEEELTSLKEKFSW